MPTEHQPAPLLLRFVLARRPTDPTEWALGIAGTALFAALAIIPLAAISCIATSTSIPATHTLAEVGVGTLAVVLGVGLAASQWHQARTSTAGISSTAWALYLYVNLIGAGYGLAHHNWYLVVAGTAAAAFNLALLTHLARNRSFASSGARYLAATAAACAGYQVGTNITWTPIIATLVVASFALRIPQINKIRRSSHLEGISTLTWTLALVNNVVWSTLSLLRHDTWWAAANIATGVITATLLITLRRRRHQLAD